MKVKLSILLLCLGTTGLFAAADAEALTEAKCGSCHIVAEMTPEKIKNISAPPMWGIVKKVKERFQDEAEGMAFINDFVMNPEREKMLFPASTFERFGLMPSLKETLSQEELDIIIEHIYR